MKSITTQSQKYSLSLLFVSLSGLESNSNAFTIHVSFRRKLKSTKSGAKRLEAIEVVITMFAILKKCLTGSNNVCY